MHRTPAEHLRGRAVESWAGEPFNERCAASAERGIDHGHIRYPRVSERNSCLLLDTAGVPILGSGRNAPWAQTRF